MYIYIIYIYIHTYYMYDILRFYLAFCRRFVVVIVSLQKNGWNIPANQDVRGSPWKISAHEALNHPGKHLHMLVQADTRSLHLSKWRTNSGNDVVMAQWNVRELSYVVLLVESHQCDIYPEVISHSHWKYGHWNNEFSHETYLNMVISHDFP